MPTHSVFLALLTAGALLLAAAAATSPTAPVHSASSCPLGDGALYTAHCDGSVWMSVCSRSYQKNLINTTVIAATHEECIEQCAKTIGLETARCSAAMWEASSSTCFLNSRASFFDPAPPYQGPDLSFGADVDSYLRISGPDGLDSRRKWTVNGDFCRGDERWIINNGAVVNEAAVITLSLSENSSTTYGHVYRNFDPNFSLVIPQMYSSFFFSFKLKLLEGDLSGCTLRSAENSWYMQAIYTDASPPLPTLWALSGTIDFWEPNYGIVLECPDLQAPLQLAVDDMEFYAWWM